MRTMIESSGKWGARSSERGAALVIALFLITVLTILGVLVLNTSIVETKMANNQKISSQAFYAAEAGLERALAKVVRDLEQDSGTNQPWGNNLMAGADTVRLVARTTGAVAFSVKTRTLDMWLNSPNVQCWSFTATGGRGGTTVGRASYQVFSYAPNPNEIYFLSYATQPDAVAAVEYHLQVDQFAPYNNALFTGNDLNVRNIKIAGSVYAIGGFDAGNGTQVMNGYDDAVLPSEFDALLGDVTDLGTKVMVTGGEIDFGGSAAIGTAANRVAGVAADGGVTSDATIYSATPVSRTVPSVTFPSITEALTRTYGTDVLTGYTGATDDQAMSVYEDLISGTGQFAQYGTHGNATADITSQGVVINPDTEPTSGTSPYWDYEHHHRDHHSGNAFVISNETTAFAYADSLGNGLSYTPGGTSSPGTLTITGTVMINSTGHHGGIRFLKDVQYVTKGAFTSDAAGNIVTPANQTQQAATLILNEEDNRNHHGHHGDRSGRTLIRGDFLPVGGYLNDTATNSLGVIVNTGGIRFGRHDDDEGDDHGEGHHHYNRSDIPAIAGMWYVPGGVGRGGEEGHGSRGFKMAGTLIAGTLSKFRGHGDHDHGGHGEGHYKAMGEVSLYQVPDLKNHLPGLVPGASNKLNVRAREWRRVY